MYVSINTVPAGCGHRSPCPRLMHIYTAKFTFVPAQLQVTIYISSACPPTHHKIPHLAARLTFQIRLRLHHTSRITVSHPSVFLLLPARFHMTATRQNILQIIQSSYHVIIRFFPAQVLSVLLMCIRGYECHVTLICASTHACAVRPQSGQVPTNYSV